MSFLTRLREMAGSLDLGPRPARDKARVSPAAPIPVAPAATIPPLPANIKAANEAINALPPVTHPAVLKTSKAGLDLIKSFESCARAIGNGRFEAYPDPAPGNNGLPVTIGWGSTRDFQGKPIKLGTVWTQEQCDRKKAEDMAVFESEVRAILGNAPTTQHQFDALVSFAYNIGSDKLRNSTLMRKHRAGDYAGAQAEFTRWNRAGGKVMRGLTRRRKAEAELYGGE